MEQEQLRQVLDATVPVTERPESVHVCEAGQIKIADIELIDPRDFTFKDATTGKEKVVRRYFLKLKGQPRQVLVPSSVMVQLNEIIKKPGNKVLSFSVMKTGSGITTKYNLLPVMSA